MRRKKKNKAPLTIDIVDNRTQGERCVSNYPLSRLIKKKQAIDIQVHNHVICLLSKRNGRMYVSAKVYVFDWEWCRLSRKNLIDFAHDTYGKSHWHISEYKGGIYIAMIMGFEISHRDGTVEYAAPDPPLLDGHSTFTL